MTRPFWKRPWPIFWLTILFGLAATWGLAERALAHLDARVAAGKAGDPGTGLSGAEDWALFLTSQLLPLRQPGAATVAPGRTFRDCPDCPEMVALPPGFALIGTPLIERGRTQHFFGRRPFRAQIPLLNREGPRRLAHIAYGFALSQKEVTFAEWDAAQDDPRWQELTGRAPHKLALDVPDYLTRAVTDIDRDDAEAFARWMSARTGQHYRLPSEVEWEYAARAGTVTRYPWGNEVGMENANCRGCTTRWTGPHTGPVGTFPPNGFGLYDMIGNGWEWVADCFVPTHRIETTDGSAYRFPGCEFAVFKGGSVEAPPWQNRSGMRVGPHPFNAGEGSTIRLARDG